MQVYLSRSLKSGATQREEFEELAPTEFKVTLKEADKIDVEDRAGNREIFGRPRLPDVEEDQRNMLRCLIKRPGMHYIHSMS
jgi:hypothetical protein